MSEDRQKCEWCKDCFVFDEDSVYAMGKEFKTKYFCSYECLHDWENTPKDAYETFDQSIKQLTELLKGETK